jgi:hypothetical protein
MNSSDESIKEIDGVKGEISKMGFLFLSDEKFRIREALHIKLNNLIAQLDQIAREEIKEEV